MKKEKGSVTRNGNYVDIDYADNACNGRVGICIVCGKKLKTNPDGTYPMIEVDVAGHVMPNNSGHESQGWWEIGNECIKKVKKIQKIIEEEIKIRESEIK